MTTHRPRTSVFIATSLDGFIARPDGTLDWLMDAQRLAPAGEDFGYADFMRDIDTLVMGRKTFETVLAFDPWPYATTPVHVLSRQATLQVPAERAEHVSIGDDSPAGLLERVADGGVRRVYLDGGELIQSFLRVDLVDDLTLTIVPVLLGEGRRLFGTLPADQRWTLISARHWDCGFAQLRYQRTN